MTATNRDCFICQIRLGDRPKRTITHFAPWGRLYEADAHNACIESLSSAEMQGIAFLLNNNMNAPEVRGVQIGLRFREMSYAQ